MTMADDMEFDCEKELRTLISKFDALGNITRALFYEWREAAIRNAKEGVTPMQLVLDAWEVVGHDTAKAYFGMLDVSKPDFLKKIARAIVMSSTMMGETARMEKGKDENEFLVIWDRCPWPEFARRYEVPMDEDVKGCDKWFTTVIDDLNELFNTKVRLETLEAIPYGDGKCVRRLWMEKD
jgi:hypothetical protein